MKKNSLNLKYVTFSLAIIITSFIFASSASADTWTYVCNSGGTVSWTGYLTPGTAPYVFPGNSTFYAEGQIDTYSGCVVNQVSLSVKNNGGTEFSLIPPTSIGPNNTIPSTPANMSFTTPSTPNIYPATFTVGVDDPSPPPILGYVFAVGPHVHGSGQKVVYVPDPAAGVAGILHPALTVRVKIYGFLWPYYEHTTEPDPPSNLDAIFTIPAGTPSTTYPQVGTCVGTTCSIGLEHSNYNAVSSITGANVSTLIPEPYHVCRYDDQNGFGKYFSPANWYNGSFEDRVCGYDYPDAEVIR